MAVLSGGNVTLEQLSELQFRFGRREIERLRPTRLFSLDTVCGLLFPTAGGVREPHLGQLSYAIPKNMDILNPAVRFLALFLAIMVPATSALCAEFRLGTAAVPINPPLGIALAGYYHERSSEGVLDDILAKATVFDDGRTRAAIVVCDLISMPRWIVADV